ncbi:hypothetical protein QQ054_32180 [Oscillatoria amoena NRMC-F 0135]|nr:hypothetical protein [Oscillatoria amoena NRMC-F 0135]
MKNTLGWVIAALLVIIALDTKIQCNTQEPSATDADTVVIYETIPGDSIQYPVYVGVPIPDTVYLPDTVTLLPDTAAILSDYFQIRKYSDTIRRDSSFLVIINDSLTRNRLSGRSVFFQNLRPIAVTSTIITRKPLPAPAIFAGANLGGTLSGKYSFSPSLAYTNKQGRMLSLQYDLLNRELRAGYLIKLSK